MNYHQWHQFFYQNQIHFKEMKWEEETQLSQQELNILTKSLQQFQRGENSEGKSLFKYAKDFNDDGYVDSIKLFIKEEQTHAAVLGKFMAHNDIKRIKSHWVDNVFRKLRRLASLENSVTVLITAEIIAAIYYQALRDATNSINLRKICDQILKDEEMHINFQSYTLSLFYQKKSRFRKMRNRIFHRTLMRGTILVVWLHHRKVYQLGGFSFSRFYRETWKEFKRAENMLMKNDVIEIRNCQLTDIKFI